jgi:hypothetical protein
MKSMAELQKDDPPCECNRHHHETIEHGVPCGCGCHYTKEKMQEWGKELDRIVNADEIVGYLIEQSNKT